MKGSKDLAIELSREFIEAAEASRLDSGTIGYAMCLALSFFMIDIIKTPEQRHQVLGMTIRTLVLMMENGGK